VGGVWSSNGYVVTFLKSTLIKATTVAASVSPCRLCSLGSLCSLCSFGSLGFSSVGSSSSCCCFANNSFFFKFVENL